ncbi:MAG: DUF2158 domain-containing protein [Treponema sp.]|nr:DUF2158 domain-containing protein [Treponema sp.]
MNVGDVVFLNSNPGILMTVEFVLGSSSNSPKERVLSHQMHMSGYVDGDVYCSWFNGTELKQAMFKKQMLTKKQ